MDFEHVRRAATRRCVSAGVERDLDPEICRLFIIDGPKALNKAIRDSFRRRNPIQRLLHRAGWLRSPFPYHSAFYLGVAQP
jgi:hypothetical protein